MTGLRACGIPSGVYVWHLTQTDVRTTKELAGHTDQISAIACNPAHPELLATGSTDKTVRLWDLRAPAAAHVIHTPGSNINLAYSPDGRQLAAGDKSETVVLIDAERGALAQTIKDGSVNREEINELAWAPDGSLLLLPMGSGSISFLRVPRDGAPAPTITPREGMHPDWECALVRPVHPAAIFCIQWDPTSRVVATGAADSTIAVWDAAEWESLQVYSSLKFPARSLDFSYDGEWLAAGGEDAEVHLMSMASGRVAHQIPVSATINSVAWHPSKLLLAYSGTETASAAPAAAARTTPIWLYSVPS